jgi:hypothetical protein
MPPKHSNDRPDILLLSDSAKLARTIEMILDGDGHFRTQLMGQFVLRPACDNCWDLIIIAFSQLAGNLLDELRRDSLIQWVGCQQPELIIAPYPFECPPGEHVWYLEFPCAAETLGNRVTEILVRRRTPAGVISDLRASQQIRTNREPQRQGHAGTS